MSEKIYVEIRQHAHEIYAEGSSDSKPSIDSIILAIKERGYSASNIKRWYDDFQGFWRFSADIKNVNRNNTELNVY